MLSSQAPVLHPSELASRVPGRSERAERSDEKGSGSSGFECLHRQVAERLINNHKSLPCLLWSFEYLGSVGGCTWQRGCNDSSHRSWPRVWTCSSKVRPSLEWCPSKTDFIKAVSPSKTGLINAAFPRIQCFWQGSAELFMHKTTGESIQHSEWRYPNSNKGL